ncbi:hypothetical protein RY45_00640 [Aeromonas hydrophila]|nr:hypothetical protein RY45_00640 [Aeromonas hydrophila]
MTAPKLARGVSFGSGHQPGTIGLTPDIFQPCRCRDQTGQQMSHPLGDRTAGIHQLARRHQLPYFFIQQGEMGTAQHQGIRMLFPFQPVRQYFPQ